jgi:hypothetical protein
MMHNYITGVPSLARGAAALAVSFLLSACATTDVGNNQAIPSVSGPPIDATETGQAFLYEIPKPSADGEYDGGTAAQSWSMLGREDLAAKTVDSEYQADPCPADQSGIAGMESIIDAVVKNARSHRIVIVNESHSVTRHRDFTRQLLAKLKVQGFTVFAAETFANNADGQNPVNTYSDVSWVHKGEGWYSNEPAFGRLVRTAKALKYRLAAYEEIYDPDNKIVADQDQRIELREMAQAKNLAALLSSMAPDERLLVHVGYHHAVEAPILRKSGKSVTWMAGKLKALTGLDPLTVAQTECRSASGEPFLAKATSAERADYFDMTVSHPVDTFTRHRPDWRRAMGDLEVPIPAALRPNDQPLVIEAFVQGDPFDAVPMDRVYVEPGEDVPLLLPPGKYTIRAVRLQKQ